MRVLIVWILVVIKVSPRWKGVSVQVYRFIICDWMKNPLLDASREQNFKLFGMHPNCFNCLLLLVWLFLLFCVLLRFFVSYNALLEPYVTPPAQESNQSQTYGENNTRACIQTPTYSRNDWITTFVHLWQLQANCDTLYMWQQTT